MTTSPSTNNVTTGPLIPQQMRNDVTIEILDDLAEIRRRTQQKLDPLINSRQYADVMRWTEAVCSGLEHPPRLILASRDDSVVGVLPLALVKSLLFGRFLVSLPYVNTAGVCAADQTVATRLVDQAIQLADNLRVRHLELRHERKLEHPGLADTITSKVHMRLPLPDGVDDLWQGFKSKVRNKVKKGERYDFSIHWGGHENLADFHRVFSHTMRDLGTPVFGRGLFQSILESFGDAAELCVVRDKDRPVAVALLVHGENSTSVPSAASLHAMNSTNVNDWMYWQLLKRAVERGQKCFDFGRCTPEGNTFTFKKKWGAEPEPAIWQYYVREGSVSDMRLEGGKYDRAVKLWQKLPVPLTRVIGPAIVRGIP